MNRRHLRAEYRVVVLLHLLCEEDAVICRGLHRSLIVLPVADAERRNQGADADARRTEVIDLVDFQHRINLVGAGQNIGDLVGCDRIEAAAEGIQLHKIQFVRVLHKARRRIKAGVVHPLVGDHDRALDLAEVGDAVFGQNRKSEARNHIRNAVMNLGIDVIGATRKDNAVLFVLFAPLNGALALGLDILLDLQKFRPARMCRGAGLGSGNSEFLLHNLLELGTQNLFVRERHEGAQEADVFGLDFFDVILNVLGVACDNRAVIVVARAVFLIPLVGNAGIEDGFDAVLDEPAHMAVGDFCGIAFRLRGDGLNAELVYLSGRNRREYHTEAEFTEEDRPERVVLVEIQNTGDADGAAGRLILREGLYVKETVHLVIKEIRNFLLLAIQTEAALTAVARDEAAAAAELVHGEHALVVTTLTARHGGLILQRDDLVERQHGGRLVFPALACDQGRAEGTHDAGNVGAHALTLRRALEGAEHSVIVEGTALHHNVLAEARGIGNFDDLKERVLDDRVSETGRNIGDGCALLLRLFDVRVHEDRTAGTEVHGILCKERLFCKILHRVAERLCKGLDEGAAARRAGLVQLHGVNGVILDTDALHILTAYVKNTVHVGLKKGSGIVVRNGLNLALVKLEGSL